MIGELMVGGECRTGDKRRTVHRQSNERFQSHPARDRLIRSRAQHMGHEAIGIVEDIGSDVERAATGR
jgi:threonine dehydrogenase-like Zn-dependent dehydrogenase